MLAVFALFFITQILTQNFENGVYLTTVFNILLVSVSFNLLTDFFFLYHMYLGRESRSEDRMCSWRKDLYYI